jgi:hypothetical protein
MVVSGVAFCLNLTKPANASMPSTPAPVIRAGPWCNPLQLRRVRVEPVGLEVNAFSIENFPATG